MGWSLVNQGRCNEAIPLFEKATKIDPKYANAYNNWGWALAHDRRYDEAIEKFQKAIDIDRANNRYNVYVYHNYTTALLEQGNCRRTVPLRSTEGSSTAEVRSEATTKNKANAKSGQRRPAANEVECAA